MIEVPGAASLSKEVNREKNSAHNAIVSCAQRDIKDAEGTVFVSDAIINIRLSGKEHEIQMKGAKININAKDRVASIKSGTSEYQIKAVGNSVMWLLKLERLVSKSPNVGPLRPFANKVVASKIHVLYRYAPETITF